jgi:signal transduction histidine kinase/CHASE2 domain-containing sensor protein
MSALVTTAIVITSAVFGMVVAWQAPGLERYGRDWLMRVRGPVPVSDEIAIVAIDDASIAKLGRFPWARSVMARAVDAIAAEQPKAIAIDVLFTEPSTPADDQALADAIGRAHNVILGAQLVDRGVYSGEAQWLTPMPLFAAQAAATGHVNVAIESDGAARQVLIEQSDDKGNAIRALPVETYRIGNRIPAQAVVNGLNEVVIGPRSIPIEGPAYVLSGPARVLNAARMAIDYAGPSGAFAAQQYSISELLEGKTAPGALRGKYVLVGSTAASLGERFASPFTHYADAQGNQHGASLPGVEVLANALNTIVRGRFYAEMPEVMAFGFSAMAAWLMLTLLALAQGKRGLVRHIAAVIAGFALILVAAWFCFTQFLVFPPLIGALVAFGSAGVSGLAARSIGASVDLDRGIGRVLESLGGFGETPSSPDVMAESIVRLTGVTGALLLRSERVVGAYGYPGPRPGTVPNTANVPAGMLLTKIPLGGYTSRAEDGLLVLLHPSLSLPSRRAARLAEALALASLDASAESPDAHPGYLPEGLEEKAQRMIRLSDRTARQAEFFHSSMRSVEDGLMIADPDGRIRFANPQAGTILDCSPEALAGRDLLEVLSLPEAAGPGSAADLLEVLAVNRHPVERELHLLSHRYTLRMAPVAHGRGAGDPVIGIVASLADITRQHELAQTRSDVVTLVSHEMRTPLTAIQGMTELLANYEIEPVRRKEMTLAINDEVKRLTRMIGDYLDIARIEMGKTPLRCVPLRLESVVDRCLLLFEPSAEEKSIRLLRNFDANLPAIMGDADLLSRVFGNLVSNALKYSAAGTDVSVSIRGSDGQMRVAIEDHGYGIPPEDIDRIFEKFYRVPRLQDADVPGTGLGLTFVREIVELHGGTVRVRSSPGAGSVFTVYLPCGTQSQGR